MSKPRINGAYALGGRVFVAGDEAHLVAAAQAAKFDLAGAVKEGGPLEGDWSAQKPAAGTSTASAYPDGFPGRAALERAGVMSAADAQKMTKAELVALDNIGEATADAILAFKA